MNSIYEFLLNDEDVKFCLDHLPKDKTYEDGKNTGVNKQNTESNSVPDEVKKLISSRFYDTNSPGTKISKSATIECFNSNEVVNWELIARFNNESIPFERNTFTKFR